MKTSVAIPHHDYSSSVRTKVEERLRPLEDISREVHSVHAVVERERDLHRVELVANVARGHTLVADVRRESFKDALGEAVRRMSSQLKKLHGRIVDRRHGRA